MFDSGQGGPDDTLHEGDLFDSLGSEDPSSTLDDIDRTVLSPPPIDGRVGQWLDGRYEVLRVIGEGGMAVVYECLDHRAPPGADRRCALKLLDADVVGGAYGERFAREIRIISSLESAHIVRVRGAGHLEDGRPYMVEELLLGRTLAEVLEEQGRFDVERALAVIDGVLAALEVAHAAGVVHRDLKPENIFLQRPGARDERPKVLDFGFAMEVDRLDRRLTTVGTAVGTPKFMAPEQFLQSEVDARADLYAVGVLLYRMLAGRAPFEPDDPAPRHVRVMAEPPRIGWMHINNEVPPLAGLPPAVDALLGQLLAKKPRQRPPDAAAVRTALRGEDKTSPARPVPVPPTVAPAVLTPRAPRPVGLDQQQARLWPRLLAGALAAAAAAALVLYLTGGS